MNCCQNCFVDSEIRGIILSISGETGSCDYCGATEQSIVPVDELQDTFVPLLELYESDEEAANDLFVQINSDWSVFRDETYCRQVLHDVSGEKYGFLLSSNVKLKYTVNDSVADWASFADEIKKENRFFIQRNVIVQDIVKQLLNRHTKIIKAGTIFFRGRISDNEYGFTPEGLHQPPNDKATPGRANPDGISYLYLAKEKETTLYEIGASLNDYVCIGEFKLLTDIKS